MINKDHKKEIEQRVIGAVHESPDPVGEVLKITEELEKAYGNCQACYGKGYFTVREGTRGYADFVGDKPFNIPPHDQMRFCDCGRGQGLKRLLTLGDDRMDSEGTADHPDVTDERS